MGSVLAFGLGCGSSEPEPPAIRAASLPSPSPEKDVCPLCGGRLTRVGDDTDDPTRPSENLAVWNRSICANMFYRDDSVICTRCRHAYSTWFNYWERGSELPESFQRPLGEAIRHFPLPPAKDITSAVVYSQTWTPTQRKESVAFWCTDAPGLLASFGEYAGQHDLALRTEPSDRFPNQVWVVVEAKPKPGFGVAAERPRD